MAQSRDDVREEKGRKMTRTIRVWHTRLQSTTQSPRRSGEVTGYKGLSNLAQNRQSETSREKFRKCVPYTREKNLVSDMRWTYFVAQAHSLSPLLRLSGWRLRDSPSVTTSHLTKQSHIHYRLLHLAPFPNMPPILTTATPSDSQRDSIDWAQLFVILAVVGILLIQTVLAIAYIRFLNLSSKARWRRLRQRGVVFVNGPALIWTSTIPPAPLTSTFNLRQIPQNSKYQVAQ